MNDIKVTPNNGGVTIETANGSLDLTAEQAEQLEIALLGSYDTGDQRLYIEYILGDEVRFKGVGMITKEQHDAYLRASPMPDLKFKVDND